MIDNIIIVKIKEKIMIQKKIFPFFIVVILLFGVTGFAEAKQEIKKGKDSKWVLIKTETPSFSPYSVNDLSTKLVNILQANLGAKKGNKNIEFLANSQEFGNVNIGTDPTMTIVVKNPLGINEVQVVRLIYNTTDVNGENQEVSAAAFLPPKGFDYSKIKGVFFFFHPTQFLSAGVPSYDADSQINIILAGLFVTQGYIGISADYIGMGYNAYKGESSVKPFHPYVLYPKTNALTAKNALVALSQYMTQNGIIHKKPLNLYVGGYSEGGAYSVWFARQYQQDKSFAADLSDGYKLIHDFGVSGAYDVSGVIKPYLFKNEGLSKLFNEFHLHNKAVTTMAKPGLAAYAVNSYNYWNGNDSGSSYSNSFYDNSIEIKGFSKPFNPLSIFGINSDKTNIKQAVVAEELLKQAVDAKKYQNMNYSLGHISILSFVNKSLETDEKFNEVLNDADVYNWTTSIPITLFYLKEDSVVPMPNSLHAQKGIKTADGATVTPIQLDNKDIHTKTLYDTTIDHLGAMPFFLVGVFGNIEKIQAQMSDKLKNNI